MSHSHRQRVCVQWPRFGPYHLARLRAAHALFAARGVELVGLETAGDDELYAWRVEDGTEPFRRERVFPGRVFERIPPAEMHRGVTAALDRLHPDAVATNSYAFPDARACLAWCRRHRRPAVVVTDSKADDATRVAWRELLKRKLVSQFDAALVGGTPHRAYLEGLGIPPSHIFVGCDVVDNAFFAAGAEAARRNPERYRHLPGLDEDTPFFLAVNRLLPVKNLDRLIHAYAAYRRTAEGPPWRLVLLGDGPGRLALEALVAAAGIGGVTFSGFRQIEELPAYYGLAGAFVHPTLKDTWGLVVNEAMAAGLPVLVSEAAGCARDLIRDGENGYRFDPADTPALAALLGRMAASPTDRAAMGRHSEEIIAGWSPETFAAGLWNAVQAAAAHSDRPFAPSARLLMGALRAAARHPTSFHAIKE